MSRGTRPTSRRTGSSFLAYTAVPLPHTCCRGQRRRASISTSSGQYPPSVHYTLHLGPPRSQRLLSPSTRPWTSTTPQPSMLTIRYSCPAGRSAQAVSGFGPPGRGIQRRAGSESLGEKAQEGSGILGARRESPLGPVPGVGRQLVFAFSGSVLPSIQCPLQLLLALGSRQVGGHGGTSPFWHSSASTCTRPSPQSQEERAQVGRCQKPGDKPQGSAADIPPASFLLPVSPGQSCKLQGALSWEGPGQGAPPFLGGGSTQLLWRLWWPPPQETLQGSQGPHSVHAPATVEEKRGPPEILQGDTGFVERGRPSQGDSPSPLEASDLASGDNILASLQLPLFWETVHR